MKHLRRNRAVMFMLSIAMAIFSFSSAALAVEEEITNLDTNITFLGSTAVPYLDENGELQTASAATSVEASSTAWGAGWYVVDSDGRSTSGSLLPVMYI